MTLILAGMGISERPTLPREVIEEIHNYSKIYLETYTSPLPYSHDELEKLLAGRRPIPLRRRDLEDGIRDIIEEAREEDILILVYGDPLIATTHKAILIEARRNGVETRVYHNASSYTAAVGEAGLDIYRVGASGTLVRGGLEMNRRNIEILVSNLERGLHTLYFLEYDAETGYMMQPREAVDILLQDPEAASLLEKPEHIIIVLTSLGTARQRIDAYRNPGNIPSNMGSEPSIIIVTAKPHFTEMEYIEYLLRD